MRTDCFATSLESHPDMLSLDALGHEMERNPERAALHTPNAA